MYFTCINGYADVTIRHNFRCIPRILCLLVVGCQHSEAVDFVKTFFFFCYFKVMCWDRWSELGMYIARHIHQGATLKHGVISCRSCIWMLLLLLLLLLWWWWWFSSLSLFRWRCCKHATARFAYVVAFCSEQQKVGQVRPINIDEKSPDTVCQVMHTEDRFQETYPWGLRSSGMLRRIDS